MDYGDVPGQCAASAPRERARAGRDPKNQPEGHIAGTNGPPSAKLQELDLPQSNGSAGIRAGELRWNWTMARTGQKKARRRVGHASRRRIVSRAYRAGRRAGKTTG